MTLRKFVLGASLAGLLALGVSVRAFPAAAQSQSQSNQSSDAMTVYGKVASIGSDHKSFSLETNGGGTMQFVLDQNARVQGRVSAGTAATVQYHRTDDGKLLCLSIAQQNSGDNNGNPQP